MKSRFFYLLAVWLWCTFFAQAQEKAQPVHKEFDAVKIHAPIHVDGVGDEPAWSKATVLTGFTQWDGDVGKPATSPTEVRVLYSNKAVYILAKNYDQSSDIRKELSERDGIGNADFFGFFFDPFLSEIEGTEFIVSAAGTQFDAKLNQNGEDDSWDAVWDSAVKINEDSWSVEIEIPYSAIRFPSKDVQTWGINFFRRIQRLQEKSSWNPIDPDANGFVNQAGLMVGIQGIDAPIRLSATPFLTAGIRTSKNGTSYSYGGGGDVKLGLSNAFTLDMTIIPDFSQTRSDEAVLNISPFETYYSERRPFFTEGTELFDKANIIYTRRIGGQPFNYWDAVLSGQSLAKNPDRSQLINATKISGRTDKKLGLGFLNAVEARTFAETESGEKILTNPLTNYNVMVLDQQLKNNSSIAIINSNVFREGATADANVTGLDFDLNTKSRKWGVGGTAAVSQILRSDAPNKVGHKLDINTGKRTGKVNYWVEYEEVSNNYDQRDFGYQQGNNTRELSVGASFRQNKPTKYLRNYSMYFNSGYERRYKPNQLTELWSNFNFNMTTKKLFYQGFGIFFRPIRGRDYYEPRREGRFYATSRVFNFWYYFSTNQNKKLAIHAQTSRSRREHKDENGGNVRLDVRYRISDKLSTSVSGNYNWVNHFDGFIYAQAQSLGYESLAADDILLGLRNRKTFAPSWSVSFKLNTKMTFSFYARDYWTQLNTVGYHRLKLDGSLESTPYLGKDEDGEPLHNQTFNAFNIDFVYRWHFSPGSDLYLTWKSNAGTNTDDLSHFGQTFSNTFKEEGNHSVTLKVLYYLDYNSLRRQ